MDTAALWDNACVIMRTEMSEVTYNTWISIALRPLGISGDRFFVEAVTDFYYQFVVPRYAILISNALSQAAGRPLQAQLLTPKQASEYRQGATSVNTQAQENIAGLNAKYTFDTFVVGNNNRFAHAASLAVAESPADTYNPLFIYGGVGLGKTHLMHAIGHYVLSQKPTTRVRYITTELFTNEMISSIQNRTMAEFREKYRNIDVLLVDDIQFLSGRESTQEEFFHTFNALHAAGRQIIISSDKSPKEIAKLEERLRSRFEWGLIADIARPDLETRVAILQRKARDEMLVVEEQVLELIAERVVSNIRELEGCLTRLVAYSSLTGRPIDVELANEALREVFARSEPRHVTCADVLTFVAKYYNVTVEDLTGSRRNREISVPRQVAMYICRELVDVSLQVIGEAFKRDHSTVMHACAKIGDQMKSSPTMTALVDDLCHQLQDK